MGVFCSWAMPPGSSPPGWGANPCWGPLCWGGMRSRRTRAIPTVTCGTQPTPCLCRWLWWPRCSWGAGAQVWVSLFPLVSRECWASEQLQQSCSVSLHSGQALPACAGPLQVPAPPQVWASRSLPAQPGPAGPAAAVCPGRCPLLQEGLVTLRSWHRGCAGNELLLSLGSSSSCTAGAVSHLLGRAPGCWGWVGADSLGITWPDGHCRSLPTELPHPPRSGAQGVTTTLGKMTLCHHFRRRQGPCGAAEQRMIMVGRLLGPAFGRQEKMGEGRAEPMPGLGSFWWLPLLWVQFPSSSSSPLPTHCFPGCLALCSCTGSS